MGDGLRAQDQDPVTLRGNGESLANLAIYLDRTMRTGRETLAAPDAGLVYDLQQERLVARHRNSIGGAHAHACQAGDTELGVDREIQGYPGQGESGKTVAI